MHSNAHHQKLSEAPDLNICFRIHINFPCNVASVELLDFLCILTIFSLKRTFFNVSFILKMNLFSQNSSGLTEDTFYFEI